MVAIDGSNFELRRVRSEDKLRVIEFTRHTWGEDHEDYIQETFDKWLHDPRGQFTAVEIDGQPVAIGRLVRIHENEYWLEGLRVDVAYRRQGIGEVMHKYHVDLARRKGAEVLRYATGADNVVSQKFGERTGFEHISDYHRCSVERSSAFERPNLLTSDDLSTLLPWLDSRLMRDTRGLYAANWKWMSLSPSRLQMHLQTDAVYGLRDAAGLRAWAIAPSKEHDNVLLQHLDGRDRQSTLDMAQALRRIAADVGKNVDGMVLTPSHVLDALAEAGYSIDDFTYWILELRMSSS